MIVHINQFRFMPALNYFQRMMIADAFIYRDDVQFQPKCWENRNKIKTKSGWQWLTVPVKNCPIGTNITEAKIDNALPWARKTLSAIRCNYARAPYFRRWFPEIEAILSDRTIHLADLNWWLIEMFTGAWGIECRFVMASELRCQGDTDAILIAMLQKLGADTYLSGSEGRNYNRPEEWEKAGIALTYHDYEPVEYPQQFGEFIPWMSALDLLMNCGADGRRYLEL
jgi:hypothetical protein